MSDAQPIVRLAARGDGVTADGRYVPLAAPGDIARFDAGVVTVEPGPHHADPPCRHFPDCGGCQLQHVDDAAYAEWIAARIVAALAAQGVRVGEIAPAHLSPPRTRRRAALRAMRRQGQVRLGFNAEASHRIVDLRECHILEPALFALVAPLRALLADLLGEGQGVGVTLTASETGPDLLLSNLKADALPAIERLARFAADNGVARLSIETAAGIDVIAQAATPVVRLGGVTVELPPAAFLQATRDGELALQRAVSTATAGAGRIADLFCGLGTFALSLAGSAKVHAVDAAGPAVKALGAAAQAARRPVTIEHRDLFRNPLRPPELKRFDAVVFDPPRAGAGAQTEQLARSGVPRVIAVSCNPNTFARDAATLVAAGYRLERLWPVGQFRWSTHVELVAAFGT